ncbi:MAG: DNA primase [bacterium]|nr:DNA primase [bacterium]
MGTVVEDVKDKLDVVEVIKSYIPVFPAGRNFKACCPFHKEKTPSFMIAPERRSWHCFGGCNEGGDVISFVMKYENVEFYDALKLLAERAGIDPARLRSGGSEYKKYDALYAAQEAAVEFFRANMTDEIWEYALGRGLTRETIAEFEIGYAPPSSDLLLRHLVKKGLSMQDIEGSGLVFRTERGTYWDRFRGRLMFPLYNHVGKVVGFTGRIMPQANAPADIAKYVNSPETPIFQKSKILYGFHKSKGAIREAGTAVLVEGQMDFLMSYQSGVKNVIATSGTALTADHLLALRRIAEKLLLCFDSDEAGQRAIERGIDLALAHDFSVGVVALSEKDPADIAKNDPALLATIVAAPQSAREFYFNRYLPQSLMDPDERKRGARLVLLKIKALTSPFEQSAWIHALSTATGVTEHVLHAEMERMEAVVGPKMPLAIAAPLPPRAGRKTLIIDRIIKLGGVAELVSAIPDYVYTASPVADLQAELETHAIAPEDRAAEVKSLTEELRKELHRERLAAIKARILAAQATKDEEALKTALTEFDNVMRQLHTIPDGKRK